MSLSVWAARLAPFLFLFLAVFTLQHIEGVCWLAYASYILSKLNSLMRGQLSERKLPRLALVALIVSAELYTLGVVSLWPERGLVDHLRIQRFLGTVPSFLTIVWVVLMYDMVSKHISLGVKALWLMLPGPCLMGRKASQLIGVQEALFSMHRDMLPIPLWYTYLSSAASYNPVVLAGQVVYLGLKATRAAHNLSALVSQAKGLVLHGSPYGTYVASDEMLEHEQGESGAAPQCSICHDHFRDPIRTKCRHVFCSQCLEDWMERDVTCPLCRAVVSPPTTVPRGSTVSVLPTIF